MIEIQNVICRLQQMVNPCAKIEFGTIPERAAEQVCRADADRTYALTAWRPQISLNTGLEKSFDFYAGLRKTTSELRAFSSIDGRV
jgi:hypothetical protein